MVHSTTTKLDPSKLNEAQADGLACIACGSDDQPMKPVDIRDGVQVFACTSHTTTTVSGRLQAQVEDAVKLNDRPHLTNREAGLIFRLGSASSVILADELGCDIRDFGISDVHDIMSAREINELVWFVRELVARRLAGAA